MYRVLVVGDLKIGEETKEERCKVVKSVKHLIDTLGVDAAMGNLEVPLTTKGFPSDKLIAWRSSPSLANDLKEMGFTVLSLATNHALDYGVEGLLSTIDALQQAGIAWVGAGRNIDEAMAPVILTISKKLRVAVFAFSCTLPGNSAAGKERPGVAPIHVRTLYEIDTKRLDERPGYPAYVHTEVVREDLERVGCKIRKLKSQGYFIMILLHWGIPYQKQLAEYQRPLARFLAKSGCDLIVGSHPHTNQAIELVEGMPVFYSLGNFIDSLRLQEVKKRALSVDEFKSWQAAPEALIGILEFESEELVSIEVRAITIQHGIPHLADTGDSHRILKETEKLSNEPLPWNIRGGVAKLQMSIRT